MAEPLLRKTFAKLRARRRKSLKGVRAEDSEVSETTPVATNGEGMQAAKCAVSEGQSDRSCTAGSCRSPGVPVPSCSVDCTSHATCTSSLTRRLGPEQDAHPVRQSCSEARKTRSPAEGGEIWYNPIPEDEDLGPVPRRQGTSMAQWYVEVPCPEAKTAGSDGARRPGHTGTPGGTESMPEPQAPRCPVESSPLKPQAPSHSVPVTGVPWGCSQPGSSPPKPKHSDGASDVQTESSQGPVGCPRPAKKSSAARRSLSDRVKSPGTVRKLSMRMRKLPELRRKLSLRSAPRSGRPERDVGGESGQASLPLPTAPTTGSSLPPSNQNVICRYHLDSSVTARSGHFRSKKQRNPRSLTKLGYLSDGDSPELVAKAEKPLANQHQDGGRLDMGAFRPYGGVEPPRCLQYLSGLINIRLFGIEGVRLPRTGLTDIFCAIQVDSVSKARTALLTCQDPFLSLDHTFNIELERSQQLKLLVFTWDPSCCRNRVCCHGTAVLPPLFRGARTHQLAMQLEPRGVLYLRLSLVELWEVPACCAEEPRVFRVELNELVERERSGVSVPLLIQKCVSEIEKRGLKAVGVYRLCGSAAVKKELRDSFERDSVTVELSEENYPDINVITGILKDYLRELPSPLITKTLYDVVLEATAMWPLKMSNGVPDASLCSVNTVALLDCLPHAEKATLTLLLDHLSLVASLQESNRMTCQNLAVCFGPVLLGQKQDNSQQGSCAFSHSKELASALDFKRHIEVLHYLLQLWPSDRIQEKRDLLMEQPKLASCRHPRQQMPVIPAAEEVVCRNRVGRSASSSRYRHAGDWSSCGRNYLRPGNDREADDGSHFSSLGTNVLGWQEPTDRQDGGPRQAEGQDDCSSSSDRHDDGPHHTDRQVGGSDPNSGHNYDLDSVNGQGGSLFPEGGRGGSPFTDGGELDFESSLSGRTKDFDSLIADIERELAKKIIFL